MGSLHHAIKIKSSRNNVYEALTNIKEMAEWHLGKPEGKIDSGADFYLTPKPGLRFGWHTGILVPGHTIVQHCIEGPGSSVGKTLKFILAELEDGETLITLDHGDWDEGDPHLPFCNTHWGEVLHRLQEYVEQKQA